MRRDSPSPQEIDCQLPLPSPGRCVWPTARPFCAAAVRPRNDPLQRQAVAFQNLLL